MMDCIYKTWFGQHIDLSKIVSISDAYWIDRMGSGGWFVGFHMEVQLRDKPLCFEFDYEPYVTTSDKDVSRDQTWSSGYDMQRKWAAIWSKEAEAGLQVKIDELISAWKAHREWMVLHSTTRVIPGS